MEEIWKSISGYDDIYQISSFGRIRSKCGKADGQYVIRKNRISGKGYPSITLHHQGERKYFFIHRLVAEAFIPNPKELPQINHKDGNKRNNCVENLEWCTNSENMNHCYENRLTKRARPVLQFDKDGTFIKRWDSSAEISRFYNVKNNGYISDVCNGKRKTAYGYVWKFADD